MRSIRRDAKGSLRATRVGPSSKRFCPTSSASGSSRMRGSGKRAGDPSTSPTPRSWRGSPSIAIKSAEQFGLEGPLDRWRELAAAIHADVCRRGFDAELGSFVQSYGSKHLDASLLLLPVVGFLPPEDARVRGTLHAIERRLLADGFVMRYDTATCDDGLPPGEGAFLACSFWLVDAYIAQQRWQDARRMFDRLLALRNDVGLLSEEYDPRTGRLVGNFPQAFTHLALVNSAFNLTHLEAPEEHRARPAAEEAAASAAAGE